MMTVLKGNIIEALEKLSDYEYQKTAWFSDNEEVYYDYIENIEDIFDLTGLQEAFKAHEVVFNKNVDKALYDLGAVCDALGYTAWDGREKELLESKEMAIIREMAKHCLKLIAESDNTP